MDIDIVSASLYSVRISHENNANADVVEPSIEPLYQYSQRKAENKKQLCVKIKFKVYRRQVLKYYVKLQCISMYVQNKRNNKTHEKKKKKKRMIFSQKNIILYQTNLKQQCYKIKFRKINNPSGNRMDCV